MLLDLAPTQMNYGSASGVVAKIADDGTGVAASNSL
jgi:hypothetical protein